MSVDVEKWPLPVSGPEELNFRRFLLRCYQRIEKEESEDWKRDPVFHRYVEALQDQLAQLRNSFSAQAGSEMVSEYVRYVAYLADSLLTPDVPLYCKKLPKNIHERPSPRNAPPTSQPSTSEAKPDVYRHFGRLVRDSPLGEGAKSTLQMHSEIQEDLTEDLLKLARDLKHRTVAMESALEKRDAALDSAADALEFSTVASKEASKRAAKQYKTSKMGTCRRLLMLLFVGCVFAFMIVFIRLTSFVGYRAKIEL